MEAWFSAAQQWLFEAAMQPLMFNIGLGHLLEDGYAATGWLLVGLIQLAILLAIIGPMQRMLPVEPVSNRREIFNDVIYTLIHRLGVFSWRCSSASSRCSTSSSASCAPWASAPSTSTRRGRE